MFNFFKKKSIESNPKEIKKYISFFAKSTIVSLIIFTFISIVGIMSEDSSTLIVLLLALELLIIMWVVCIIWHYNISYNEMHNDDKYPKGLDQ